MASRGWNVLGIAFAHWLTTVGVVLTTTSAFVFLGLAFLRFNNPYYGLVVFVLIPALFVVGLVLIPLGLWIKGRSAGGIRQAIPVVEWSSPRTFQLGLLIGILTMGNITIVSAAAYKSIGYMDSSQFCGTVCHSVMSPQYMRYQDSIHSRVECVNCHVGSGAAAFVQYKMAGARQLMMLASNTYERPIPPALPSLRPANETCESCHSLQKMEKDRLRVFRHYAEDEESSPKISVLMMHVGNKIHQAHVGRNIQYISTDDKRQVIPWVSVDGKEYVAEGEANGTRRTMDCMDCHNRQGHDFLMPPQAVDRAIADGRLDRSRPFTKRDAVLALTGKAPLENAPEAVQKIYSENVFPQMSITWGTYPNNLGHDAFPGCFRCHDDGHKSKSGDTITQDCSTCHELIVVEEKDPEILKQLGMQ
jgi:nitrate/TMAO reductase-like tetraheme cytochrome c subunit